MAYQFTQTGAQIQSILNKADDTLTQASTNYIADCDNAIDTHKWYWADTSSTNIPFSGSWVIVPIRLSSTAVTQLAYRLSSTVPTVYIRNYQGGAWGNWKMTGGIHPNPSVSYGTVTTVAPTYSVTSGIGLLYFSVQLPAGTYSSSDTMWTISPAPRAQARFVLFGSGEARPFLVNTNGEIKTHSTFTLSSASYFLGQAVVAI